MLIINNTINVHVLVCFVWQLQEQLDRFMKMNGELRSKQSMMQAQLKGAAERKVDLETDLCEKQKEVERLVTQLEQAKANTAPNTVITGVCVFVCMHNQLSVRRQLIKNLHWEDSYPLVIQL